MTVVKGGEVDILGQMKTRVGRLAHGPLKQLREAKFWRVDDRAIKQVELMA